MVQVHLNRNSYETHVMNLLELSFKKVYTMLRKALQDAKETNALKLIGFKKRMLIEAYNWNLFIVVVIK